MNLTSLTSGAYANGLIQLSDCLEAAPAYQRLHSEQRQTTASDIGPDTKQHHHILLGEVAWPVQSHLASQPHRHRADSNNPSGQDSPSGFSAACKSTALSSLWKDLAKRRQCGVSGCFHEMMVLKTAPATVAYSNVSHCDHSLQQKETQKPSFFCVFAHRRSKAALYRTSSGENAWQHHKLVKIANWCQECRLTVWSRKLHDMVMKLSIDAQTLRQNVTS